MSKKLTVILLLLVMVGVGFAANSAPFGWTCVDSTKYAYTVKYKIWLDVADSAGAATGPLFYFPDDCIGAYIWQRDADTGSVIDTITLACPGLYQEDTLGLVGQDEWITKAFVPLDEKDTLMLFNVWLGGQRVDIDYMIHGDTIDTLWATFYILDREATYWLRN